MFMNSQLHLRARRSRKSTGHQMTCDSLCTRATQLQYEVGGDEQTGVSDSKVDPILVHDTPDIVQPVKHALDCFCQEFLSVREAVDERTFGIASELVQHAVDLL